MHVCVGSLTIGGEEEVCGVLLRQPSNLIDLLLDLQTLKVVELGLMALKGAVDIVLSLGEWLSLALRKEKEVRENVGRQSQRRFNTPGLSQCPSPCEEIAWHGLCTAVMIHSLTQQEHQLLINQSGL